MNFSLIKNKIKFLIINKFYKTGFTTYNCILFLICIIYEFKFENLYAIITCSSWNVFFTFHSSLLLDNNSFYRMQKKHHFSYFYFHIGNIILHDLPCLITMFYLK